jgi:pimeloyl-ACP methyl ester carboxylesterase
MWSGSKARSAPPSGTLDAMADTKHVVLIHGTWLRGDSWADTRAEFEQRGYTVHTPTLRFHDLPFEEGAKKVGPVSLRDYADDLAALVEALDSPPLLIGHSLGGLIAQLAAARTRHAGVVAACTAPAAGIFSMYPSTARILLPHYTVAAVGQAVVSHDVEAVPQQYLQHPHRGGGAGTLCRSGV